MGTLALQSEITCITCLLPSHHLSLHLYLCNWLASSLLDFPCSSCHLILPLFWNKDTGLQRAQRTTLKPSPCHPSSPDFSCPSPNLRIDRTLSQHLEPVLPCPDLRSCPVHNNVWYQHVRTCPNIHGSTGTMGVPDVQMMHYVQNAISATATHFLA